MTHPTTPPTELVQQWFEEASELEIPTRCHIATRAAQWGADQELEACCEWLMYEQDRQGLRVARRPKPPSLKEQALEALERQCLRSISPLVSTSDLDTIRRVLEALPDD